MQNKFNLKKFIIGALETNAYLVFSEKTKNAFLIDCPAPICEIVDFIRKEKLNLKFIVFTHGHYDHIDGLEEFLTQVDAPFYISKKDEYMLINPMNNGFLFMGGSVVVKKKALFLGDGQKIKFEGEDLEIIETPGHTLDGISILFGDKLFSGDTLFYHTIGRADLPYSDYDQLIDSIKNKLFVLDDNIKVFPGHGRETTVEEEKTKNPFLC